MDRHQWIEYAKEALPDTLLEAFSPMLESVLLLPSENYEARRTWKLRVWNGHQTLFSLYSLSIGSLDYAIGRHAFLGDPEDDEY